jgi:hypothetical protein
MRCLSGACGLLAVLAMPVQAADIGGWFAEQQRVSVQAAAQPASGGCAQVIGHATADPTAIKAYHAALCYLQADSLDLVAAKAWWARAADLKSPPAVRLLRALQAVEEGPHSNVPHCHDLGEGRQVCHGGTPVAASRTN